jgi:hypothetical protein
MKRVALRIALATALIGSCALVGLTPANAVVVSWDLSSPANQNVGLTETFTASGINLDAAGFSYTLTPTTGVFTATDLYTKQLGGFENGLGINSDPTTNHEIWGNTLVRLDTTAAQAAGLDFFQFAMGSSTNGEGWTVYGSNSANSGLDTLIAFGSDQGTTHNLTLYNYYYFAYNGLHVQPGQGDNVLLHSFAGSNCAFGTGCGPLTATPLPAALPLFAGGLGVMSLLARRRKRKNAAAIAA